MDNSILRDLPLFRLACVIDSRDNFLSLPRSFIGFVGSDFFNSLLESLLDSLFEHSGS
jgi:hypothetical protein